MSDEPRLVMVTRFNTGRRYTSAGQRIVAGLFDNGHVAFRDVDRMIDEVLATPFEAWPSERNLQVFTMHEYDYSRYMTWVDGPVPYGDQRSMIRQLSWEEK